MKTNLDSFPCISLLKFSLCLTAMNTAQMAAIKMTGTDAPNGNSKIGQRSIAMVVEIDIYRVIKSNTIITTVAISPTRQLMTYLVDRQTRNPLPPLNLYWNGKA